MTHFIFHVRFSYTVYNGAPFEGFGKYRPLRARTGYLNYYTYDPFGTETTNQSNLFLCQICHKQKMDRIASSDSKVTITVVWK